MTELKFCQWNCHRSTYPWDSARIGGSAFQAEVWMLQEPYTFKGKVACFRPGYKTLFKNPTNRNRSCLVVNSNLRISILESLSNDDFTVALLERTNKKNLVLVTGYLDIQLEPVQESLEQIMNYVERKEYDILMSLDANAWSPAWGMENSNERGEQIEEFIIRHNLSILNEGHMATYERENSRTIIDLTLANQQNLVKEWQVHEELIHSDHRRITFVLSEKVEKIAIWTRNLNRVDWSDFRKRLNRRHIGSRCIENIEQIDQAAEEWTKNIIDTLDEVAPRKEIKVEGKVEWFTTKLREARDKMRKAYRIHRRDKTDEMKKESFKTIRNSYHKLLRKEKRNGWIDRCKEINNIKDMAKLNKVVNRREVSDIGLLKEDGREASTLEDSIDILLRSHFERSTEEATEWTNSEQTYDEVKWVNESNVKRVVKQFKPHKNTSDGVKPLVLQNVSNKMIKRLVEIFRASIRMAYTPEIWRKQQVAFIPKPAKKDYSNPRSFRPVTLASFVFKSLEKLVLEQVEKKLGMEYVGKNQHGFRKGRSCDSALSEAIGKVELGFLNQEYSLAVYLDIQGCFDCVEPDLVNKILKVKVIDQKIVKWYEQIIKNRLIWT